MNSSNPVCMRKLKFTLCILTMLQQQTSLLDLKMNLDKSASMDMAHNVSSSKSMSMEDSELTGKVGSALYVSPEMLITSTRAQYNQVHVYSYLYVHLLERS